MRLPARLLLAVVVALAVWTSTPSVRAGAQPAGEIVSVTLAPPTATVGDRLTLTIVIDHPADAIVEQPGFGSDFGGLEVVAVPAPVEDDRGGGTTRTTLSYVLTSFRTGDVTVPSLAIALRSPDGTMGRLSTVPQRVTVASVLPPGDTTIRPLKPQIDLGTSAPSPLVPALIVAGFAALTALGYGIFRRAAGYAPPALSPAASATPETPWQSARRELDSLTVPRDPAGDLAKHYGRVAAILRTYLSRRFDFPAYAMTRTELERHMRATPVEAWPARLTVNLLEQCDAVVFAGFVPAVERREADLTAAYEIVRLTEPEDDGEAPGQ